MSQEARRDPRRHHGHAQTNASGRGLVQIQRPLEAAAARLDAGKCRTGADPAVLKFQRGRRPGGDRQEDNGGECSTGFASAHNQVFESIGKERLMVLNSRPVCKHPALADIFRSCSRSGGQIVRK